MTPEQLEKQKRFYSLVILIPILIGLLWLITGAFSILLSASVFDDDFEAYDLGNLYGQGGWTKDYTYGADVVDDPTAEGVRAVATSEDNSLCSTRKIGTPTATGTTYFYAYFLEDGIGYFFIGDNSAVPLYLRFDADDTEVVVNFKDGCSVHNGVGTFAIEEWVLLGLDWNGATDKTRFLIGDTWSGEYDCDLSGNDLDRIVVYGESQVSVGSNWYLDFIDSEGELPPIDEKVWSTSPASGTEITDLETAFEFEWEGLDDWDTLSVVFHNRPTGIYSEAQEYIIETTSPSGSMALEFQDFGFDRNGVFYFYGVATRYGVEFVEGMYITGRYSYEWSSDLVDPESWFTINIEGFEDIFGMTDFEEWYVSISKFATPTDMFVSIAGFFDPIFGRIGEFGNRIKDYFDLDEVYSQGYEIGKTIPYFSYFVGQISVFFGGFPILKWVGILILILIGFFIFRLVLKFIPFLGGS